MKEACNIIWNDNKPIIRRSDSEDVRSVAYPGFSKGANIEGVWGTEVPQRVWGSAQLAHFWYLKANYECSEALHVLNGNVQCVCYNQKLTIIVFIQKCSQ